MQRAVTLICVGLALLAAAPALAVGSPGVESRLESVSTVTHHWSEGPVKHVRKLAVTWYWSRVGEGAPVRYHGRVERVELEFGGDDLKPLKYDSAAPAKKLIAELPVEVAGYAAWVGGELDFELGPDGAITRVVNAEGFADSLLDRLGAPATPIRGKVLGIAGSDLSEEGLKAHLQGLLEKQPLRVGQSQSVPGFPTLLEKPGAGAQQTEIIPVEGSAPGALDLGIAKVKLELTGQGSIETAAPSGKTEDFVGSRRHTRALKGTAMVVEMAPTMAGLPGSWPVTIEIVTTVASSPLPASQP